MRALLVLVGTLAGAGFGFTMAVSCNPSGGECPENTPIELGEFSVLSLQVSESAAEDMKDITVTQYVVEDQAVVVFYHRDGDPGVATFSVRYKYADGLLEIIDAGAAAELDAGASL